jgi:colanic acid/amylovoran biosynthesis glycosyltransferase
MKEIKQDNLNICIVQPNLGVYSETFIQNHSKYLKGNIFVLHGNYFPIFSENKNICDFYFNRNIFARFKYNILKLLPSVLYNRLRPTLRKEKQNREVHQISFEYYLKYHKVRVVLAEYGYKGAIVADSCVKMGIKLVVHFHGHDAHAENILEEFECQYKKMFISADAIVGVSQKMMHTLIKMGSPKEKTKFIPYGVDTKKFCQNDSGKTRGRLYPWVGLPIQKLLT